MSRKVLGIDIRKHSIIAVLVKSGGQENSIEACVEIPVPAETDEAENGIDAAFESLAQTIDIGDCDCIASFPSAWFSYRNIRVPFSNPKKIRMVLPFELEPTLPFKTMSWYLIFKPLKPRRPAIAGACLLWLLKNPNWIRFWML